MPRFKVWDPDQDTADGASWYEAACADTALEDYAKEDVDGQESYWGEGINLMVMPEGGKPELHNVSAYTSYYSRVVDG